MPWTRWLALMLPYSLLFLAVDTLVMWRVVNWFNARCRIASLLPIRASAYILSILNEQVGKGAIALYLNRHARRARLAGRLEHALHHVLRVLLPAQLGDARLRARAASACRPVFRAIPWIALAARCSSSSPSWPTSAGRVPFGVGAARARPAARLPAGAVRWHYATIVLLRSPAMLGARSRLLAGARLFGVEVELLDRCSGYLPVIFFWRCCPCRAVPGAVMLWTLLFPEHIAQMAAFGLVQHNFFVLFNAAIGLLFLRRANRELFGAVNPSEPPSARSAQAGRPSRAASSPPAAQPSASTSPARARPSASASRTTTVPIGTK